jgi:hypothetical protein
MDLICHRCGEPWDLECVLDVEPQEFDREGCWIRDCPCCAGKPIPELPQEFRDRLNAASVIARSLGDDYDGYAAFLEDMQLTV